MKRQHIFRGLMAVMLLLSAGQSLMAQEAFYIYRNDGDFNGFFYDQVIRMNMSKVDFDGVEHEDYVIQEVLTEDSLYRIPLVAIDSISFIQPEIIFNPRLKNLAGNVNDHFSMNSRARGGSGECMTDWVRMVENGYFNAFLYFDMDTPKELLPEVGDVLVDFYDRDTYGNEYSEYSGFSGKVTHVFESRGYMVVRTDRPKLLSDIFVQFITVEEVVDDGVNGARSRIAGWPIEDERSNIRGAGTASLVDINVPLKQDFEIGKGSIGVELGVGLKVKLGVSYNITMSNLYVKAILIEDFTLKGAISGKYDGDYEAQITGLPQRLSSIKFPATAPIFQTKPIPGAFLRVKGEMGAKLDLPTVGFRSKQVIVFDTDDSPMMSCSSTVQGPEGEPQKGILDGSDLTLYMNGSVQIGAKFSANIETNDWIDAVFSSGIYADFYVGPQVDGQIEMKTNLADLATGNVPGIYSAMKESHLTFAGLATNVEVKGSLKILDKEDDQTFLELNKKWMDTTWYIFPKVTSNEAQYDQEDKLVECKMTVKRPVFLIQNLGLGVYDAMGNCVDKYFNTLPYFLTERHNEVECTFNLPFGRYWVRPLLKVADAEVEVDDPDVEREVLVTPMLYHENPQKADTVQIDGNKEEIVIHFKTDVDEVEVTGLEFDNGFFMHGMGNKNFAVVGEGEKGPLDRILTIHPGKNPSPVARQWSLVLKVNAGSFETKDTIVVVQGPGYPGQTEVGVTIHYPLKGTKRSWGTHTSGDKSESYDTTEECELSETSFYIPATFSSNGKTITLMLDHTSEDSTPKVFDYSRDDTVDKSTYIGPYTDYSGKIVINIDSLYITSGDFSCITTTSMTHKNSGKNSNRDEVWYYNFEEEKEDKATTVGRWIKSFPVKSKTSSFNRSDWIDKESWTFTSINMDDVKWSYNQDYFHKHVGQGAWGAGQNFNKVDNIATSMSELFNDYKCEIELTVVFMK
jgi:hypothetical protein